MVTVTSVPQTPMQRLRAEVIKLMLTVALTFWNNDLKKNAAQVSNFFS